MGHARADSLCGPEEEQVNVQLSLYSDQRVLSAINCSDENHLEPTSLFLLKVYVKGSLKS